MRLKRLHRRFAVLMCISGIVAFLSGAGLDSIAAIPTLLALCIALFWQASVRSTVRVERTMLVVSLLLAARALYHVFILPDDVVIPMADLLLVLVGAEALKSVEAPNDLRLYSLSFALLIASTAYRPSILFGLAFLAYTALATVALMLGHVRRQAERRKLREPEISRGFLMRMAALSGVAVIMSGVIFLVFPRVSRGWASRTATEERPVVGFGDEVSLAEHGSRIYSNPEIVLRVEFPQGRPQGATQLYWRGRSYDAFDGVRWSRSPTLPLSAASVPYVGGWSSGPGIIQLIYAAALDTHVLFGLHPIFSVRPRSRIRPFMDESGDFNYFGNVQPVYEVASFGARPDAEQLRSSPDGRSPAPSYYLQLPEISDRIRRLADSLTAGKQTRYDKAMAIQSYLHTFGYTLELPATARQATLEYFLFRRKQGHCEYFSTAMVVLLRAAGIPARNVNGFLGGDWNEFGNYLAVTQNHAHSWVEVWFPGYNWVPFDPTPPAAGTGERIGSAWYWPLRFVFDGLEHRWDKWILDYDLEKQVDLFRRTTEQFSRNNSGSRTTTQTDWFKWLLALVAFGVFIGFARGMRRERLAEVTRIYLKLRRLYERSGYEHTAGLAPLAFVRALRAEHAPGAEHAERAVDLYLNARFGTAEFTREDRAAIIAAVDSARGALRARGSRKTRS